MDVDIDFHDSRLQAILYISDRLTRFIRNFSTCKSIYYLSIMGVIHAFSNPFAEVARALITLSPHIVAQCFLDVGNVMEKGCHQTKTLTWQ